MKAPHNILHQRSSCCTCRLTTCGSLLGKAASMSRQPGDIWDATGRHWKKVWQHVYCSYTDSSMASSPCCMTRTHPHAVQCACNYSRTASVLQPQTLSTRVAISLACMLYPGTSSLLQTEHICQPLPGMARWLAMLQHCLRMYVSQSLQLMPRDCMAAVCLL